MREVSVPVQTIQLQKECNQLHKQLQEGANQLQKECKQKVGS